MHVYLLYSKAEGDDLLNTAVHGGIAVTCCVQKLDWHCCIGLQALKTALTESNKAEVRDES